MALAILRRKRFFSGTLGNTANTAVVTAGAAPADGSAKATVQVSICNKTAASVTAFLGVGTTATPSAFILNGFSVPPNDTYVHAQSIDLMGTEILSAWAGATASLDILVTGVEANDS